ncbi:unnamed protein product [Effrenium voratum]|uniref:Signal recognition particle SRP54 subunit M-domain domain-containing protein n=1 Tax=Effrenium voratum TaxID=2562239 RepID=A0AA36MWB3_9DINO|nr:unnamed protein product [Effrenium voratum]CAJ1382799.1 unnamed protein product [Effrenium voratum]
MAPSTRCALHCTASQCQRARCLLVCAFGAFAAWNGLRVAANAFAGSSGLRAGACGQKRTLRRGLFEDLQQSFTDSAVQAASGLTKEENEALMENCRNGKMSIDDYLTVMRMFSKLGEVGNSVAPLKNMLQQGNAQGEIDNAKEKLVQQEALVNAMTKKERANPDVFVKPGPTGRKALERWAGAAGKTEKEMMEFLLEYRSMKSMFAKLGQGEDFSDVQKQLAKERDELMVSTQSRKARRSTKTRTGGKAGKQPEWMTL